MHILGDLAASSWQAAVLWAVVRLVRIVLDYRLQRDRIGLARELLQRTPNRLLVDVIRSLKSASPNKRR
ncbi:hypothetical protein [Actinomadura rupiterrae]|uniref:hypothetical protein n=1 Tax=Actinomadura rupiterrae TaxID=559627 RepID=UPI0020A5B71C|nr:hypothetical protein [Actinomadura rupiterrae]MCP2337185.1 hypothetical protein [Actinomadura rupiterrae]